MFKSFRFFVLLVVSAAPMTARAGDPMKERAVELFAAMDAGEIEAEVIAPSPRQVFLRVNNKTNDMLKIELPKAFAAVPVLAQWQPGGFPGGGFPAAACPVGNWAAHLAVRASGNKASAKTLAIKDKLVHKDWAAALTAVVLAAINLAIRSVISSATNLATNLEIVA